MKRILMTFACLVLFISASMASSAEDNGRFDVQLDSKSIGYHHFQLRNEGAQRELLSETRFDARIRFVNVYHYAHNAHELWLALAQKHSPFVASRNPQNIFF